jgi:hypothetical protein
LHSWQRQRHTHRHHSTATRAGQNKRMRLQRSVGQYVSCFSVFAAQEEDAGCQEGEQEGRYRHCHHHGTRGNQRSRCSSTHNSYTVSAGKPRYSAHVRYPHSPPGESSWGGCGCMSGAGRPIARFFPGRCLSFICSKSFRLFRLPSFLLLRTFLFFTVDVSTRLALPSPHSSSHAYKRVDAGKDHRFSR